MAVKFSQFTVGATLNDIDYLVGYKATNNIQIPVSLVGTGVESFNTRTGAITFLSSDIPDLGVTEAKIANFAITQNKMANNAISSSSILGINVVTTTKIADGSITTAKLANDAVNGGKIATSSDVQINSLGVGTAAPTTAGLIRATNDVVAFYSSDKRLKDNIKPIENALDKVCKLGGYEFDWNSKQDVYEGHDIGVIAQEVEAVFPELVTDRDNGFKAVKYEKLIPALIEAIKELKATVESLKSK